MVNGTCLITGSSSGVGRAAAIKFLENGYRVFGLDISESTIEHDYYEHYICDVSSEETLPELSGINYIVNNAGIVTPQRKAIKVNLEGYINIIEKYGKDPELKSLVQIVSSGLSLFSIILSPA